MKLRHARLLQLLHYNPDTGVFTRRVRTSSRAAAGDVAGTVDPTHGYRLVSVDGVSYYEHRLAWFYVTKAWPKCEIDHRNRVRNDNRFSNLRHATRAQNSRNATKDKSNTSGIKGVCWHKGAGKWMAQIRSDTAHEYLGVFSCIEDAAAAYARAAVVAHGKFASPGV